MLNIDEVAQYQTERDISSNEAVLEMANKVLNQLGMPSSNPSAASSFDVELLREKNYNMADLLLYVHRSARNATVHTAIENRRVIIMLRNINQPKLCNGMRLAVKKLMSNVVKATVLTGPFKGENALIPCIDMIPTDKPFQFKRLQFPIRLAFAFTINNLKVNPWNYAV
ncbi:unnamed protein product [Onchocerca ochengi]|uniref:ATP-dependent DNA helicase n=1 Tax=Onchocerca ochengi TaxID=42157 RepID=A0A182E4U9_ONCOC|nr:unnamed protein product [Onchocerca ochengi]